MTRKYRPHQCPKCVHLDQEAHSEYFKGLCIKDKQKHAGLGVWLEGESTRLCPFFTVKSDTLRKEQK